MSHETQNYAALWADFKQKYALSDKQLEAFQTYAQLLIEWNQKINLTAIETIPGIIDHHFHDSLHITQVKDFAQVSSIADVGTGAGFPAIPLKIMYPHISMVLIEVLEKRRIFLQEVIDQLDLQNMELCELDWRTFLRKTDYTIDVFIARASLAPEQLINMFKPDCHYKSAQLIYWASYDWQPQPKEEKLIVKDIEYKLDTKKRRYIFFQLKA